MKKYIAILLSTLMILSMLAGCGNSNSPVATQVPEVENPFDDEKIAGLYDGSIVPDDAIFVTIQTSMGDIDLTLFPSCAPKAVENFTTHAKEGYYDNVIFHRVIDGFMIQTGDPTGTGAGGESIWGEDFEVENDYSLFHFYGAISMAKTDQPVSNGSQFFIVNSTSPEMVSEDIYKEAGLPQSRYDIYSKVGGASHLDYTATSDATYLYNAHTVFGYVTNGMDVVNAIAKVETKNNKPIEDVYIKTIIVK